MLLCCVSGANTENRNFRSVVEPLQVEGYFLIAKIFSFSTVGQILRYILSFYIKSYVFSFHSI